MQEVPHYSAATLRIFQPPYTPFGLQTLSPGIGAHNSLNSQLILSQIDNLASPTVRGKQVPALHCRISYGTGG